MTRSPDMHTTSSRRGPRRLWIGPAGRQYPYPVHARRAELLQVTGDWTAAEQARARNLEAALAADDAPTVADARFTLAPLLMHTGRYAEALEQASQARQGFDSLGDRLSALRTLAVGGEIENMRGNFDAAMVIYTEELGQAEELGDEAEAAQAHNNLGNVYRNQGRFDLAMESYHRLQAIAEARQDRRLQRTVWNNFGVIHRNQGRLDQALDCYQRALAVSRQTGDRWNGMIAVNNIGTVHSARHEHGQAIAYYQELRDTARALGDKRSAGRDHAIQKLTIIR